MRLHKRDQLPRDERIGDKELRYNHPGEREDDLDIVLGEPWTKDAARSKSVIDFFRWSYANGKAQAESLHYVPLPDALEKQVEAYWAENFKF